jgi:hypothetical protein
MRREGEEKIVYIKCAEEGCEEIAITFDREDRPVCDFAHFRGVILF